MLKKLCLTCLILTLSIPVAAATQGQLIDCDSPDPAKPGECPDNWALDLLDESKTTIQNATDIIPRNRKHYFGPQGVGVHVFVLDTGVDGTNPDFKVLGDPSSDRVGAHYEPGNWSDRHGNSADGDPGDHGTRVAGLIAGLKFGVAKGATIYPIYASGMINPTSGDRLLDRLDWIYEKVTLEGLTPAVLNMSFNIPRPVNVEGQLTQRVKDLINAGVVVTVSAGNQSSTRPEDYWPSVIPEVILVGGIDQEGQRWTRDSSDPEYTKLCTQNGDCGSNYGSLIDVWAPAEYIRSAVSSANKLPLVRSGTSFAAPLVAGLAALRLSQYPTESPSAVLAALKNNAAVRNVDGTGSLDYILRSPVASPPCNIVQRIFVNQDTAELEFLSSHLRDSCPSGYDAYSQYNASHGTISLKGIGASDTLYSYTPDSGYTGLDQFTYTIYTDSASTYGTGTVKVTVQPPVN